MRQPAGDDEIALARPAGDRRGAGVALQSGRVIELVDVFTDLARDPGGEQIPKPGHAQVDLTARERLPRVGVLHRVVPAGAGPAQQQLGHPGCQPRRASCRASSWTAASRIPAALADEVVPGRQRGCGQRGHHAVGEPVGPAVPAGAGELDQLLAGGAGQLGLGGPALQQPQHRRRPQVLAGEVSAAGIGGCRSARSRLSSRRWSRAARSSSRPIARSSPPSSPCGIRVLSAACRSSASRQQIRASSASSFFRAGPRRRATRSGLTGTTVNPASSSASTSRP